MKAVPLERPAACDFVNKLHRHHQAVGHDKFRIGAEENGQLVGVIQVGRPVSRVLDDTNDKERSMAMEAGSQLLLMCSEVWVFGLDHPSEGMQAEIALAIRHGIPIIDGDEILSGKKKPEHHDELDARLYAAGAKRYERRRDPEAAAACEAVQKKALDDFDRWLKRQLKNPERQHQRIQILAAKRRRREE